MPAKDVVIRLRGDTSGFQAKMVAAGKSVEDFGKKVTSSERESQKFRRGLTSVGDAAGKMGLVAAVGLGAVVAVTARFDKQMSAVQAATHETAANMELLRSAAIKAGAETVFSASEAAAAIENLAKAGVSTADILKGGLNGALSLAAAGQIEVADAAEYTATALTQFHLAGDQAAHVADLLAAGAGKAQGEVSDMANAMNYAGVPAANLGVSIEETAGTIALFAKNGIIGEQAGTSLRGMLASLTSPSKQAAGVMKELGINVFDASGNFVGFDGVAAQLQDRLGNLTDAERANALGRIFGNEQLQAANVLYREGGQAVDDWTKKVNDQGYAAETAAIKLDNLSGDIEQLKGSLETALIGSGEGSQGFLRGVTQGATGAVNAFNSLPPAAQNAATGLLAITAVTGSSVWLGAKTVQGIADTRAALEALGPSGVKAGKALNGVAKGAQVAGIALAALALQDILQGGGLDKSLPTLNELANTLTKLGDHAASANLPKNFDDLGDAIDRVGDPNKAQALQDSLASVIGFGGGDDVKNFRAEIDALDGALASIASTRGAPAAAEAIDQLARAEGLSKSQVADLVKLLPGYRDALAAAKGQAEGNAEATGTMTVAAEVNTNATQDNVVAIKDLIKARHDLADETLSAFDAETAYQRALDEGAARIKDDDFVATLDKHTEAGRKNRDVISDMARAWNGLSDNQKNAKGAYHDAREALVDQATQFGLTRKQAERYIDKLKIDIPPRVTTRIELENRASKQLDDIKAQYDAIKPKTVVIRFKTFRDAAVADANRAAFAPPPGSVGHADGGYTGDGGKYEPAGYVHRGEFVVTKEKTAVWRPLLEAIHSGQTQAYRSQAGYAGGGYVTGPDIDYDRLTAAILRARPLYGDVHLSGDDSFRRAARADARRTAGGGRMAGI